ncbi:hypothetical protein D7Z54_32945 [Salibacterium salarium]|uniref:Homeodomain phBC6A51-type domain-containing protein n=1 Tax=Salibacterium salarium TaxID=284579 RepID=A0A3R9QMH4_9BACI|nr:phBC6A51 family helix-turn-helix protein [Salibacterium salarium]RSL29119.1 hypothetical protein D7Z54_32945 [Salibacterium salarium]
MSTKRMRELESKLTLQQRKAALLLVEKELAPDSESFGKTNDDVAELVGCHVQAIYKWKRQNKAFIEYMNLTADDFLSSHRSEVYRHLMTAVRSGANGSPSIKAIDTFLKRFALLTERQVTEEAETTTGRENDDIQREIAELDSMLDEVQPDAENGGGDTDAEMDRRKSNE